MIPLVQEPSEETSRSPLAQEEPSEETPRRAHLMFSGCSNCDRKRQYMKEVKKLLDAKGVQTFMVEGGEGVDCGPPTQMGLWHAKGLLAFCADDYGGVTGAKYETYVES